MNILASTLTADRDIVLLDSGIVRMRELGLRGNVWESPRGYFNVDTPVNLQVLLDSIAKRDIPGTWRKI